MSRHSGSYNRAVYHGGDLDHIQSEYGGKLTDWIDLSTGINPIAYPVPELPSDLWQRLPGGRQEQDLLSAARAYYALPESYDLVAAPGTQSLIQYMPRLIPAGSLVAIKSPTYAEHETCWRQAGHHIISLEEAAPNSLDILVIVNPNNPTGTCLNAAEMKDLKDTYLKADGLLIIDEAFMDITPDQSAVLTLMPERVILLKSFGKFFGLAGLRLGFAAGDADFIQKIRLALGPWALTGAAAYIGAKAYSDDIWINETRARILKDSNRLGALIEKTGGTLVANCGLFLLADFEDADRVYDHLCQHQILTRPFNYSNRWIRFGLPATEAGWSRIKDAFQKMA